MLMCERGIRETVTDRKGGISFTILVNHMNEQRYFHSSFQSFSTQSCNTKNSASPEKQKYINLNYTELSVLPKRGNFSASWSTPSSRHTCMCRMTRPFQILTVALSAGICPNSNSNCTSINKSYLLNSYVNMCMYFATK